MSYFWPLGWGCLVPTRDSSRSPSLQGLSTSRAGPTASAQHRVPRSWLRAGAALCLQAVLAQPVLCSWDLSPEGAGPAGPDTPNPPFPMQALEKAAELSLACTDPGQASHFLPSDHHEDRDATHSADQTIPCPVANCNLATSSVIPPCLCLTRLHLDTSIHHTLALGAVTPVLSRGKQLRRSRGQGTQESCLVSSQPRSSPHSARTG